MIVGLFGPMMPSAAVTMLEVVQAPSTFLISVTPPGSGVGPVPAGAGGPKANELVTISWLAGPPASSPATVKAAPGIAAIEVTVKSAGVPGSVGGTAARQPDSASPVTAAPVAISATLRRTGVLIGVLLTEVERRSTLRTGDWGGLCRTTFRTRRPGR